MDGNEGILSSLSLVERAWNYAKISMNSTNFRRFGENANSDRVQTLYDYCKNQTGRDGKFRDPDALEDDKLRNYFVITVDDPTGISEDGKVDLIVDATGHDVAITYVGEDGVKFEISPEIIKNNSKMLENLKFAVDMNPQDIAKLISPKDMDQLVREIHKNDTVAMRSTDDAKNRADQYDRDEERAKVKLDAKEKGEHDKDEEEKRAEVDEQMKSNKDIPQEMYSDIMKICMENDLDPNDLKQTLTVKEPASIMGQIDNSRTKIRENGGEVTMLRFKNKEIGSSSDRVFMVQQGQLLKEDKSNDAKMTEIMEDHKGNGDKISNLEDTRLEDLKAELEAEKERYLAEREEIEMEARSYEGKMSKEDIEANRSHKIAELDAKYEATVSEIGDEYAPPKTKEIEEMEEDVVEEAQEEAEQDSEYTDDDFFDENGMRKRPRA